MREAGGLDSTFLALETRGHPLHVMAVMMLDRSTVPGGYSFEKLRDFVADQLGGIPPFRQKLVSVPLGVGRPHWVDVEVDVDEHLHRVIFDGGGLPELARFVADLEPVLLDRDVPLWSMHVVEGLDHDTVAVVAKVHHALMDGVGGMQFMAGMFSLTPTAEPVVLIGDDEERTPSAWERVLRAVPDIASAPVRAARALVSSARAVLRVRDAFRSDETVALPTSAPHMRWNDPLGPTRAVAFASLPLDDVKVVGRAVGATVNDVVLAVLGGTCRSYLAARGELPDRALVTAVPVSVRQPDEDVNEVANAVTLMFASLGTDIADPRASRGRALERARRQAPPRSNRPRRVLAVARDSEPVPGRGGRAPVRRTPPRVPSAGDHEPVDLERARPARDALLRRRAPARAPSPRAGI